VFAFHRRPDNTGALSANLVTADQLRQVISSINPQRAFALFLCALASGGILVFGDWGKPYSPSFPILAYGFILAASQEIYGAKLEQNIKDSVLVLGFLIALLELFEILLLGFPRVDLGTFLFDHAGAAVLATAVGLFMRQSLLATSLSEGVQNRFSRPLADEVRNEAIAFHDAQRQFVNSMRQSLESRKRMFSTEQESFDTHLTFLEDGAARISNISRHFESILSGLETTCSRIPLITSNIESEFQKAADAYQRDVETLGEAAIATRTRFKDEVASLGKELTNTFRDLKTHSEKISHTASSYVGVSEELDKAVSALASKISGTGGRVDKLSSEFGQIISELGSISQLVDQLAKTLGDRIIGLNALVKKTRGE
jgi:methyl-accepting chemotaxis protein